MQDGRFPRASRSSTLTSKNSPVKTSRRALGVMASAVLATTTVGIVNAQLVNSTWNTGNGNWNVTTNWLPNDVPDNGGGITYDVFIGPAAANAAVTLIPEDGSSDTISNLTVSNGCDLDTNGNALFVVSQTTISGVSSSILVEPASGGGTAFNTNDLDINLNGALQMSGGIADIDVLLEINSGSVTGFGTIILGDADGVVEVGMENSASIFVGNASNAVLTLQTNGVDTIDLDGTTETGVVDVANVLANAGLDTLTLVVDGPLADAFNGTIQVGQRDTITFNDNFTISTGATIDLNGGALTATMNGPGAVTSVVGAAFTVTGNAVIDNDMTFSGTANTITIGANSTLTLNGTVSMPDASALALSSLTAAWVIGGTVSVNEAAGDFNWDGTGAAITTVSGTGLLSLVVDQVDTGDDIYGGVLNLNDNGDILVNNTANQWTLANVLNKNNAGTSVVSGDTVNVTGDINVNAGTLDMPVTILTSTADVAVSGTLLLGGASTLAGPTTLSGSGFLRMEGASTVSTSTTVNVATFDWDGAAAGSIHTINNGVVFTINSGTMDTDGDMDDPVNLGGSGAQLIVNGPTEWTQTNTFNANTAAAGLATIGGTSRAIFTGVLNVDGNTTVDAPMTLGATSTTGIDAAMTLRLSGGTLISPNLISGGTINGPGTLACDPSSALEGSGTINSPIDFDGAATLRAAGGTLTIAGSILDVGVIGTNSPTGVLNVVNAWNTSVADTVDVNGGTLMGGAITIANANGITGNGFIASRLINNQRIHSQGGTLTVQTGANDNDWDGAGNNATLSAAAGTTLEVRDTGAAFGFTGSVVAASNATVYSSGFALDFNPGSRITLTSGRYRSSSSTDIGGTLTVNAGGASTIEVQSNFFLTFENGSNSTLNGNLQLVNNNINIEQGAIFSGGGALVIPDGSHMVADNLADIGVLLQMQGAFRPGNSNGIGRVNLFDYQQDNTGELYVELTGTALNAFDRLVASGDVALDGYLNIDIDEVSPGVPFVPSLGQTFNIITGNTVVGMFDYKDVSGMPAGLAFHVEYLSNAVQLQVVTKPFFSADFDEDGDVDLTDLAIWQGAFNLNQLGDANGDNITDIDDWTIWREQLGSAPGPLPGASVPEPGAFGLMIAAMGLGSRRRRVKRAAPTLLAALACMLTLLSWSAPAMADPVVSVVNNGLSGGNRQWLVRVAPDPAYFVGGQSAMAVEIPLEVEGSTILSVTKNAADWFYDNPAGHNPFGGGGFGIQTNVGTGKIFIPLGSTNFFNSNAAVTVATLTTSGSGRTVVTFGGHNTPAGTMSRIAQSGNLFEGKKGFTTFGSLVGDADINGKVNTLDFNIIAANFGLSNRDWDHGDFNQDNVTNSLDFNLFLGTYGSAVPGPLPGAPVPEPALVSATGLLMLALRRNPRR